MNERAALVGKLSRRDEALLCRQAETAKAQELADSLLADLQATESTAAHAKAALEALDTVLASAYPTVDPATGGTVDAWAGKYGRRGSFKAFLLTTIERASPAPVTTAELFSAAVSHFALNVTSEQRRDFSRNLKIALRTEPTRVEELPRTSTRGATGWRWRTLGTLEDIARQVESHEGAYPLRPEVGSK